MNSTTLNLNGNGLGSFLDLFSVGAGLVDSFVDARAQRKSDESDERQLQLQLQAQREMTQANAERMDKMLKVAMIAGGVLLAGVTIVAISRS